MREFDPTIEVRSADAERMLGFRSRGAIARKARAGEIPGAWLVSPRVWAIPFEWIKTQQEQARQDAPKVGKPRGYTAKE